MLLRADEYPYHQITDTFAAVQGSDPQWNDGHYVCGCDDAGRVAFTSNVRLYQNNDVLDGFVCLRHDGRQHNVRLSRRLRPDMDTIGVGPLRLEIVEPMRVVRLVLDENPSGIALDVTCHSTAVPQQTPIEITRVDGRLVSERATYEVTGVLEGTVVVGGETIALTTEHASFFRNHSWGYQGGRGGPRLYTAPRLGVPRRPDGLRQWVLFNLPSHSGFFLSFDTPDGRRTQQHGNILHADRQVKVTGLEHELAFYAGGRRLRSGHVALTDAEGVRREYTVDDLGWVYCQGGGYFGGFDDGLGQGVYRGDYHTEGEVWDVSDPTRVRRADGTTFELDHAWAESFTRVTHHGAAGVERGLAHYECVVFGTPR
jgi:hypothetical protein